MYYINPEYYYICMVSKGLVGHGLVSASENFSDSIINKTKSCPTYLLLLQ